MKLTLLLLSLAPLLVLAQPEDHDVFAANGNRFNGQGPPEDQVPDHVLHKFRERSNLKDSWQPNYRRVPKGAKSFTINGKQVKFNKLKAEDDMMMPGATVRVDGQEMPPTGGGGVNVYKDPSNPDVLVVLDSEGTLMRAAQTLPNGKMVDLAPMQDDYFAEYSSDDVAAGVSAYTDVRVHAWIGSFCARDVYRLILLNSPLFVSYYRMKN